MARGQRPNRLRARSSHPARKQRDGTRCYRETVESKSARIRERKGTEVWVQVPVKPLGSKQYDGRCIELVRCTQRRKGKGAQHPGGPSFGGRAEGCC